MSLKIVKGFIILGLIFIPLESLFPLHPKKILRPGWQTDASYFLTGHFIGKAAGAIIVIPILSLLGNVINPDLQHTVATQPIWLQFIEAVIVADVGYYIAHRLLHTVPFLWKFHAVHHSIEQMDWLAAVRVHPCDQVFTKICQMIPLYLLGFSNQALGVYALYSAAIAFLIHANIKIKFGVLKWFIATPDFHHWHHSKVPRVSNKNFSAQFPLLDLIFGSLYMPAGKVPNQ